MEANSPQCGYKPPTKVPRFKIVDVLMENQVCEVAYPNKYFRVRITVKNVGDAPGSYHIVFSDPMIGDQRLGGYLLGPGSTGTTGYSIPCISKLAGTHDVVLKVVNEETGEIDDTRTISFQIVMPPPSEAVKLTKVRVRPSEVGPGEPFYVDFIFDKVGSEQYAIRTCVDGKCYDWPENQVPIVPGTFHLTMKIRAPVMPGTHTYTASAYLADGTPLGSTQITVVVKKPPGVVGYLHMKIVDYEQVGDKIYAVVSMDWRLEGTTGATWMMHDKEAIVYWDSKELVLKRVGEESASGSATARVALTGRLEDKVGNMFVVLYVQKGQREKRISIWYKPSKNQYGFLICRDFLCADRVYTDEATVLFKGTGLEVRAGPP